MLATNTISHWVTPRVQVWDTSSGKCMHTLLGHSDFVESVTWSPLGNRLASGSRDRSVRVWDTSSGECRHVFQSPNSCKFVCLTGVVLLMRTPDVGHASGCASGKTCDMVVPLRIATVVAIRSSSVLK
mmetsp:Transcript_32540/g.62513  ORF Transcript_32540/g.62513 Transcript_32540/m.62513 type:complete len:128 (-) Transcript_32540:1127-1510(-)